jgi:hypothetical protein
MLFLHGAIVRPAEKTAKGFMVAAPAGQPAEQQL